MVLTQQHSPFWPKSKEPNPPCPDTVMHTVFMAHWHSVLYFLMGGLAVDNGLKIKEKEDSVK